MAIFDYVQSSRIASQLLYFDFLNVINNYLVLLKIAIILIFTVWKVASDYSMHISEFHTFMIENMIVSLHLKFEISILCSTK